MKNKVFTENDINEIGKKAKNASYLVSVLSTEKNFLFLN